MLKQNSFYLPETQQQKRLATLQDRMIENKGVLLADGQEGLWLR